MSISRTNPKENDNKRTEDYKKKQAIEERFRAISFTVIYLKTNAGRLIRKKCYFYLILFCEQTIQTCQEVSLRMFYDQFHIEN